MMRLLALGDIHGCSKAFDTLLDLVAPAADDWIVALGDYVDRGPDTRGILDRLVRLAATQRLVALRGNHEEMMIDARDDLSLVNSWLLCGGQATLDSYSTDGQPAFFKDVPTEHWRFLEHQLVDWFETDTHFFVHATADPNVPLDAQPKQLLRWAKFNDPPKHRSGKIMVCGHTYQPSGWPRNIGHAVCIDTWVYGAGWLTCLDVASGQFWQADQHGQSRTGDLAEHYIKPVPLPVPGPPDPKGA